MGRLNYTNRKSEGVKLGQVCAKDLTKRIPPASGSKAAQRDPVVEIDVSSKSLTDEGFVELARALIESMLYKGKHGNVVRLEELCLRDNRLTPTSLNSLSHIVQLAHDVLRDLDLSQNEICIKTPDDIAAWYRFLRSFSGCCVLRRVDLSGNHLGTKAFEILTKVYSREQPIHEWLGENQAFAGPNEIGASTLESKDLNELEHEIKKISIELGSDVPTTDNEESTGTMLGNHKAMRRGSKSPEKSGPSSTESDKHSLYATAKGLRSVPYLVLSDTSMSETSALYLSYILAKHRTPDQLLTRVPPAKAGSHAQQLLAYDGETGCRGIIYSPNSALSSAANKALELAEKVRDGVQGPPRLKTADGNDEGGRYPNSIKAEKSQISDHRRRSTTITGEETRDSITVDLDRARSRLQGNAIESAGHRSNDLWRIAVKMLAVSRDIRPQTANDPSPTSEIPKTKPQIIRTLEIPGATIKKSDAWGTPLAPRSSNQAISSGPNRVRKDNISVPQTPTIARKTPGMLPIGFRVRDLSLLDKEYRSKLPCGFSEDVWARIMCYVVEGNGLLSHGQQISVLRYARDRGTLRKERDSLGLKEAAQIWHVLDGMNCLAYDMR